MKLKLIATIFGLIAIVAAAATVGALSANGSRQYSQGKSGVAGQLETGDYFAGAVSVGDFNGDGYGDVIAGAPLENIGSRADVGLVHIIYGRSSGLSTSNDITLHQGSPGVPMKPKKGDMFGSAVAVGDFDNDGYDDAVVGIAGKDTKKKTDVGGFSILYGSSSGLRGKGARTWTAATKGVKGPAEAYGYLGSSVVSGDFNGDGYDDIAVGAPGSGQGAVQDAGAVYVLFGSKKGIKKAGGLYIVQGANGVAGDRNANDGFGSALAAGDFNKDKVEDLAVGIPGKTVGSAPAAGAVQVFNGSGSGLVLGSSLVVTQASGDLASAPKADELFGHALAAGDFGGNRAVDLAIGSPGQSSGSRVGSGNVHVLYGSKSGLKLTGSQSFNQATKYISGKPQAGDQLGWSLVAGDFNNNGRTDLAIGVPGESLSENTGAGMVHILFGGSKGLRAKSEQRFWPGRKGIPGTPVANGGFSRALAVGDIDGDGRDDLVSGAPGQMVSGKAAAGALIVIFG